MMNRLWSRGINEFRPGSPLPPNTLNIFTLPFIPHFTLPCVRAINMAGPLSVDEILAKQRAEKEAAAKVCSGFS